MASHPCTSPGSQRHDLVAAVKADPLSPEAWLVFLLGEEAHQGALTGTLPGQAVNGGDAGGISLYHLYFWATQLLQPSSKYRSNESFIRLWIGYATHQW